MCIDSAYVEDGDVRRVHLPVIIPVAPRSRKREVIVLSMGGRTALYPPFLFPDYMVWLRCYEI